MAKESEPVTFSTLAKLGGLIMPYSPDEERDNPFVAELRSTARQYAVFISYRHTDNKEPGREWASWLHHVLESYEVPPDLVGQNNHHGEAIPASLYPVFRDEEELGANADLSSSIRLALANSRLLVIICSPRAVESRF